MYYLTKNNRYFMCFVKSEVMHSDFKIDAQLYDSMDEALQVQKEIEKLTGEYWEVVF